MRKLTYPVDYSHQIPAGNLYLYSSLWASVQRYGSARCEPDSRVSRRVGHTLLWALNEHVHAHRCPIRMSILLLITFYCYPFLHATLQLGGLGGGGINTTAS